MKKHSAAIVAAGTLLLVPCCGSRSRALPPGDGPPQTPRINQSEYVGLSRRDAALKAWTVGQSFRVVEVDGIRIPEEGPKDRNRLNFTIRNGIVIKATRG